MGTKQTSSFALWAFVAWLAITVGWWALAFAPLPAPPEWLDSARSVCFGTLPNGLPDTWGWMTLFSPLTILGFLLAVWGRELARSLLQAWHQPFARVGLVALILVPLVGLASVGVRISEARRVALVSLPAPEGQALPDDYPRSARPAPGLGLIDQTGTHIEWADLQGRTVLLTFAYAHCRTVCPVVVDTVRRAAQNLALPDSADDEPAVVIVTLDPWRDTPSSLPSLVKSWNLGALSNVHVLSGEVPAVLEVLESWEIPMERDTSNGEITHPALVHVLAPDGTIAYSFNGPPVRWLTDAARALG